MKYDPAKHHRCSIRLKGYDYSLAGAYFLTICSYQRQCLFGEIVDGVMQFNEIGQIVADEWERSQKIRQELEFDEWVIMPNHIHGIIVIQESAAANNSVVANVGVGANGRSPLHRYVFHAIFSSSPLPLFHLQKALNLLSYSRTKI